MILEPPSVYWECPNCTQRATSNAPQQVPFHACRGLHGFNVALVPEGSRSHVRAVHREDYVGNEESLTYDSDGRPVMAIVTERPDGSNDCVVLPPTATSTVE